MEYVIAGIFLIISICIQVNTIKGLRDVNARYNSKVPSINSSVILSADRVIEHIRRPIIQDIRDEDTDNREEIGIMCDGTACEAHRRESDDVSKREKVIESGKTVS